MRHRVMDGKSRVISARESRDGMFNVNQPLEAEPNDPLPAGALGVLYDGNFLGGKMPTQADIDLAFAKVTTDPSLLSATERASIAAILSRFSGRSAVRPVQGAGVVSNDHSPKSTTDWARTSAKQVAAEVSHNRDVANVYGNFWAKRLEAGTANVV